MHRGERLRMPLIRDRFAWLEQLCCGRRPGRGRASGLRRQPVHLRAAGGWIAASSAARAGRPGHRDRRRPGGVELLEHALPDQHFVLVDVTADIPAAERGRYGLVLAGEVVEHVPNADSFLRGCAALSIATAIVDGKEACACCRRADSGRFGPGNRRLAIAFQRATGGKSEEIVAEAVFAGRCWRLDGGANFGGRIGNEMTFLEADASELALRENDRFARLRCFRTVHVNSHESGLAETHASVVPGGKKLAVLEFSTPRWQPLRGIYLLYFRYVLPRIGQFFARNNSKPTSILLVTVTQFRRRGVAEKMGGWV